MNSQTSASLARNGFWKLSFKTFVDSTKDFHEPLFALKRMWDNGKLLTSRLLGQNMQIRELAARQEEQLASITALVTRLAAQGNEARPVEAELLALAAKLDIAIRSIMTQSQVAEAKAEKQARSLERLHDKTSRLTLAVEEILANITKSQVKQPRLPSLVVRDWPARQAGAGFRTIEQELRTVRLPSGEVIEVVIIDPQRAILSTDPTYHTVIDPFSIKDPLGPRKPEK